MIELKKGWPTDLCGQDVDALTRTDCFRNSPNNIDTIAVRRRVAGMKQVLLMIAVVGLLRKNDTMRKCVRKLF